MAKKTETKKPEVKKVVEVKKDSFYQAVGRRKQSSARVRLTISADKKSDFIVNGKPGNEYFRGAFYEEIYMEPFILTETVGRFLTTVKVAGGGASGQVQAVVHGIARSLEKIDKEKYHGVLKAAGLLTRDPRKKERRKAGFAQKARARKQSPKR